MRKERQKAKGKRQKAKSKVKGIFLKKSPLPLFLPFAFCPLPFALSF
jgi:hypothetical protein